MQTRFSQSLVLMLLVGAASLRLAHAQLRDPITELIEARRIFVPVEDLDVIIERDKQGVVLQRAKFDELLTQAKANAEKNAVPTGVSVVVTGADYAARIVGDQLLISVTAELTQFEDDWRETRFSLQRLALEQALVDDAPALVGRHPDGSVSLFTDSRGKHTLKLQLSTELTAQGSDQVAAFSLLRAPSGSLTLTLPAGKRLLIGNLQLERPSPLEQVADYKIAVGGTGGLQLRITDRAAENAADSLTFATTGYGLHVAPGEVTWHALTTLQVFGKPVDRLSFSVPRTLEIADVEATGLEAWDLSDDPNEPLRTNISLTFGQAFEGARKISFKGVMAVETGKPWSVPPLRIASVTSHIGQVVVQYPAGVRLRVEETAGLRRATQEQKPAADMPDEMSKLNATEFLRFDVWQPDFMLRLTTQPKQREVQAAVAAVLDVNATGLELQAALTVETHFAPLFELDIRLPAEWQVLSAQRDNQPLKWQMVGLDEVGVNQLRILLDPPLAAEASGQIRLALRRDVEGWPVEAEPITVNLPELFLPQSSLTEGAFVVRGDEDLDLVALDLTGLDPQPLKAAYERLRFQSQETRFAGKLKITRKPSRIAAQTVTFGRIDPQTFHTFLQAVVEVQGGGVRAIKVALPESTGTALRFESPGPRIVEQKPAAAQNGERIWTLQFDQRLRGQALIVCDIELPRGDAKDFVVPQWRFVDAERQNGYLAVEAGGEQRLTMSANDAPGTPLPEIDPLELPNVFYQPKERVVAVYRAAAPGAVLSLSEQKFEKLSVPTAICPLLEVSSILGRTGELQHRATFHLNIVGVQGLHVTFPSGSTLWATMVDGHPVEIRRSGDVYLVPLTNGNTPGQSMPPNSAPSPGLGVLRVVQLFYRSEVAPVSQFGTLTQDPPSLTVESGQRTALPVEVLEQKWDLHYPEETRLIDSRSPLEPEQPLDRTSILGNWNSALRVPTLVDLGWQLLAVVTTIGIIALLMIGIQQRRLLITQVVVVLCIVAVVSATILPSMLTQERSKSAQFGMATSSDRVQGLVNDPASSVITGLSAPHSLSAPRKGWEGMAPMGEEMKGGTIFLFDSAVTEPVPGLAPATSVPPLAPMKPPDLSSAAPDTTARLRFSKKKIAGGVVAQDEQAPQAGPEGAVPPRDEARFDDFVGDVKSGGGMDRVQLLGLLSLAIEFVPPAGSHEKTFHYVGADTSITGIPLEVDYVDRHTGAAMRFFVIALVAMIGWFLRRVCASTKVGLATIGFVVPLGLLPLVPLGWQVVLDGIFFGTVVAIGLWLLRGCVLCCPCCRISPLKLKGHPAVLSLAALLALSGITFAAGDAPAPTAKPTVEVKPTTTLVIPFDAGTEPLASERVFLSHEQFLQLYRLANPDKVSKQPAPQAGGIFEALYAAKLVMNGQRPDESVVEVTARYAVKSFVDGQLIVELPVGQVAAREAKLDGQTAALIANAGCFKVAVSKPGLHVIDFTFDVPARLSGTTGSFSLPLLPVPAGKLAFELPGKDLSIRVNGSSTIFRRVTHDDSQSLEFPIDKGGEVAIAWQPQQAQGAATAVVHVDSVEAVTLTDAGAAVSHGFAYRIRQGGIADTSFTLPDMLRLQAVNGPDVGGWELQGEGAARKLRVIFRRNVTDQTRLTIETFLDVKIGTASAAIAVPQIAPQEITNEIGQVAVFAGNQFSIRAEQVESLSQIDSDKFATQVPVSRPNVAPQLAYRFSKRPFTLILRATRQESQAHVTSQQAAFIALRKLQVTTRLRYNLTGAPRSSLLVKLPANFVLLDVQATGLRDYYVAKQDDGSTLTIELKAPRLGLTEVVIGGFTPRDTANASIKFPQPLDATRLDSTAAVWLDEGFTGTLDTFDGWRSVDATQVSGELRAVRSTQPVQFAFSSTNAAPSAITLKLTQAMPKMSANGLSMVTVTDVAVIYTLALQWQIDTAKTDTLTLTTPNWFAGKLEFQGEGVREATHVDAGNNRTRWTIHLRTPVSGKYFATATATLPPAATEVLAPALVFENDQKPLEPQRQYVLLINSSLSQLSSVDPSLVESVQREDVPVVVQQEFVDQATELVRVKTLLTAPKWSLHKFAQQPGAPASVNVADLTTVLSRDGTYRAQAVYTIKNRSRQFLALKMPEGTELLSVFVAGQPSRAVTAKLPSLSGSSAKLIALPKTSAASLAFPVKIVWRGRLGGALPKSARLVREEFSVPAPQILSQQEDADFGIPVARTRWTVYLPQDLDAQAARSTAKHNLSLSDDSDSPYGNAAIQEAGELLGFLEQTIESNRRSQSRNNLKQIGVAADNLKQLSQALDNYRNPNDGEFAKNKADVMRRLSEVERIAKDESQKTAEYLSKSSVLEGERGSLNYQEDGLADGMAIADGQQKALILSNRGTGISIDNKLLDGTFNFNLDIKDAEEVAKSEKGDKSENGKSADKKANINNIENRTQLRGTNDANIDALNSVVTNNTFSRQRLQQTSPGGQQGAPSAYSVNNSWVDLDSNKGIIFNQNGNLGNGIGGNFNLWNAQGQLGVQQLPSAYYLDDDVQYLPQQGGFGGGMGGFGGGAQPPSGPTSGFTGSNSGTSPAPRRYFRNPSQPQSAVPNDGLEMDFVDNPQALRDDAFGANPMLAQQGARHGQGGGRVRNFGLGANAARAWKQAGGLSLEINLPTSGRKLVFTKAGGDPKLALAIRPHESIRWGISLVWSTVWLLIGATILLTFRKPLGLRRVLNQLPVIAVVLGVLGFCVLPAPLNMVGFVMFLLGALVTGWMKRKATP